MKYKTVLITMALCSLLAGRAPAADEPIALEPLMAIAHLDKTQKIAHLVALAVVDYRQTVNSVIKHPDKYGELNPILGTHPSRTAIAAFGILGVAATAIVADSDNPIARILVDSIIATEQVNVWENKNMEGRQNLPIMVVFSVQF